MTQKRIYVGNLAAEISADDLREKFSRFGSIKDLEVKTKNESHFAFISINFDTEERSKEAIDVMNGTKWRGSWIKVQFAKEDFLDKLRREQQSAHGASQPNDQRTFPFRPAGRGRPAQDKPPTSIISFENDEEAEGTVVSLNKPTVSSPVKPAKKKSAKSDSESDDDEESGVMPFKGIFAYPELQDNAPKKDQTLLVPRVASTAAIPILPSDGQDWRSRRGQHNQQAPPEPPVPKAPADEVQSKLLSLAGMANGGAPAHRHSDRRQQTGQVERPNRNNETWNQHRQNENQGQHQQQRGQEERMDRKDTWDQQSQRQHQRNSSHVKFDAPPDAAPVESQTPNIEPVKTGVLNFKKRNSDALRQKSLENRTSVLQNQKDIIRSSLASVKIAPPAISAKPADAGSGKKRKLFGEDEDDAGEDFDNAFSIKPQFEGKVGAKNLEFSSKMASYDSRFKMDERFRDYDEDKRKNAQEEYDEEHVAEADLRKENEAHLSILNDILGKDNVVQPPKPVEKKKKQAAPTKVIVGRYDPDADEEPEPEPVIEKPPNAKKAKTSSSDKVPIENGAVSNSNPFGDSNEKASYFVASNLKDLFSSTSAASGGFSLLKSFGPGDSTPAAEENGVSSLIPKNKSKSKARNPFKYDSSDSEDETPTNNPSSVVAKAPAMKFNLGKREGFFYTHSDKRLEGVEDFFLKSDEKIQDVVDRFNSGERSELRIICRGKVKNTKRKSEKRMLTLKRMKRRIRDKKKFDEKKLEGSNAVPLGNKQPVKQKRDFKGRR